MSQKKLFLVVNPYSGRAKMRTELLSVTEVFSNGGYEVLVYPTKCRTDATRKVAELSADDIDLIVVCGGDGTLNEVICGVMTAGLSIPIGYIPCGTLNEWSAGLKISRNITTAAQDIVNGREVPLDIGQFEDKYFSYTASFGAFTEVSYSAPQDVKNVLGQAAYFFEGIKSLGNIRPIPLTVHAEGKEIEGDFLFGAVTNSMSVGGIVKFDEAMVKLNDGKFEVLLIHNPTNLLQFQNILDGVLRKDLNRDGIEFFHCNQITFESPESIDWTLDGEFSAGVSPLHIANLHHAIRFIVPNDCSTQ
ncbi:MAG: diacylglycerol kinase family lipid kinase [Clostridia bacterium]|nr:diacylglycerol kinase family lipid kinase [Clostridia bacterium]